MNMGNTGNEVPNKDLEEKNINTHSLQELEKKAQEYLDGWKRAKADYINYKKEMEARQGEMLDYALMAVIMKIVPVVDNFDSAFKHTPQEIKNSDWLKGMEHIRKQMEDILDDIGLKKIKTVGEKFDPTLHEAVAVEEKEGFREDIIFEEVKAGYTLHGKTLVAAKVKMGK